EVGSGKTKAAEILAGEFGYRVVNTGRVVAKLLGLPPVTEKTRPQFQQQAQRFIQRSEGPALLAEAIRDAIAASPDERVLVDGVRQRRTLEQLKRLFGTRRLGLLFVYAAPDVAFSFYKNRARKASVFDFLKTRDAEVETEVRKMIEISD